MNTRLYFNNNFIEFVSDGAQSSQNQAIKIDASSDSEKILNDLASDFLKESNQKSISVEGISFEKALKIFKKSFYYIEAAGGFIEKDGSYLFIRRHNIWDLPKGKLEKKESIEEGAIRECEEECGISELKIIKQLPSSFHIYAYKDGFALKQSYWFYMQTTYSKALVPQIEESITEVKWFSKEEIKSKVLNDTYYTIADVVRQAVNV